MLWKGALNVNLVQKELSAQRKDFQRTISALMELIQIWKAGVIVNCVKQASGVQVLEWRHLKNALMEHIATQLVLDIVSCVQKVIGEGFVPNFTKCQVAVHSMCHYFMTG